MTGIIAVLVLALLSNWSYNMLYRSKNNFWGVVELKDFHGYPSPVFDTIKQVRIWKRTFKWRILLEIEPLVYDPKPLPLQKDFYLKVVEQFDNLFTQSTAAIHESYGGEQQSIVKYKKNVQPLLIIVPLNMENEWRIYCVTPDNMAFILFYKGYTFDRVTKFEVAAMNAAKETEDK